MERENEMTRKIVIANCRLCPHKDHMGAFAAVACVPIYREANKELPHTITGAERPFNTLKASPTYEIPDWCPLPENEEIS